MVGSGQNQRVSGSGLHSHRCSLRNGLGHGPGARLQGFKAQTGLLLVYDCGHVLLHFSEPWLPHL